MGGYTPGADPVFDQAVQIVLRHEDGLVDDPNDPGGLTNFGFALRDNPDLSAEDIRSMTADQAAARYYEKWWKPYRWGDLPIPIACKAFDAAVNMGPRNAILSLQRACRAAGRAVTEDGVLGMETIGAAGAMSTAMVLSALRSELAAYYRIIAELHPAEVKFLTGWLNRAYE
jgi:lysozyme family protein